MQVAPEYSGVSFHPFAKNLPPDLRRVKRQVAPQRRHLDDYFAQAKRAGEQVVKVAEYSPSAALSAC